MSSFSHATKRFAAAAGIVAAFVAAPALVLAQVPLPAPVVPYQRPATPPSYSPAELDRIVAPIALYPDPLLANVLTAATYPDDIPPAAKWADDHHHLTGAKLTTAMAADDIDWDPSVQALLPFPSVLEMMASDMPWTEELGDAFLADKDAVMAAVQRLRLDAREYDYLRGCSSVVLSGGPWVSITPVDPAFITVPYYFPKLFFGPPASGIVVYCGFGVRLGAWFSPWGWGATRILWPDGAIVIDGYPWARTWVNRDHYAHPYLAPRYNRPRPPEQHREQPRTPRERAHEAPKGAPPRGPAQGPDNNPPQANPPRQEPPQATPPDGTRPPGKRK